MPSSCRDVPTREVLGTYPTPVLRLDSLCRPGTDLWVKRDDLTSPVYGGNKVRKLERLLEDARTRGARRVVTIGAVGSHHVLATTVFARRMGLGVDAILVPQPRTPHVIEDLRADLAQGAVVIPVSTYAEALVRVGVQLARGERVLIPVGGSNLLGSLGYVDAVRELATQVRAGAMPEPDLIVVTLGSGGTAGGITAGLVLEGMATRVLAVTVAEPKALVADAARRLAIDCLRHENSLTPTSHLLDKIEVDESWIGRGYGFPTSEGEAAVDVAANVGLSLDATYTAKTFAAALAALERGGPKTILYWHTLSSAPMSPLLEGAPAIAEVEARFAHLLR